MIWNTLREVSAIKSLAHLDIVAQISHSPLHIAWRLHFELTALTNFLRLRKVIGDFCRRIHFHPSSRRRSATVSCSGVWWSPQPLSFPIEGAWKYAILHISPSWLREIWSICDIIRPRTRDLGIWFNYRVDSVRLFASPYFKQCFYSLSGTIDDINDRR